MSEQTLKCDSCGRESNNLAWMEDDREWLCIPCKKSSDVTVKIDIGQDKDMTDEEAEGYFSDGLSDEEIEELNLEIIANAFDLFAVTLD